jgi:hypothetical protein
MGLATVLWKNTIPGGGRYVEKFLKKIDEQKAGNSASFYNDIARHCITDKDRRDYSKYAIAIRTAKDEGWSSWDLYIELCDNGGLNTLCGYNQIDHKKLNQKVRNMKTKMTFRSSQSGHKAGPIVILAYREKDGTYSVKHIVDDEYGIIKKLV